MRKKRLNVRDFGADPTGESDSTKAFRRAAQVADAQGGGRIDVPQGVYQIHEAMSVLDSLTHFVGARETRWQRFKHHILAMLRGQR